LSHIEKELELRLKLESDDAKQLADRVTQLELQSSPIGRDPDTAKEQLERTRSWVKESQLKSCVGRRITDAAMRVCGGAAAASGGILVPSTWQNLAPGRCFVPQHAANRTVRFRVATKLALTELRLEAQELLSRDLLGGDRKVPSDTPTM
jgi:hypothetical protein